MKEKINEAFFEFLFYNSPIAIAYTHDNIYFNVNQEFLAMFGYERDEIIGKPIFCVIPREAHEQALGFIEKRKKGEKGPFHFETKGLRKNGEVFDLEIESSTCAIDGKEYSIAHHRDITDGKQFENALRRLSLRQEAILEAVPDIIAEVDTNKVYTWMNKAGFQFFGEDAVGREAAYYFEGEQNTYALVQPLFNGDPNIIYVESRQRRQDGTKRLLAWWCHMLKDIEGNISGALSTARDITEIRQIIEKLTNAQKLDALGILAGGTAHDFNNLLGGIFGYIDLAAAGTKEKSTANYLAKAMRAIDRARGLTQQLLTFAKGGAPIKQIDTLVPFIQETVGFALSGSTISCKFDILEDLWLCEFDKNQIGQVIDNIVINSQQAMPGGGTIIVSAENVSFAEKMHLSLLAGNYVKVSIKDKGIGMPKEILSRIFDPFFTTKEKGHGLGLTTCYSIVKRHGGCIEVESEPGNGSVFHFYLPALSSDIGIVFKEDTEEHRGYGAFLIMDDEQIILEMCSEMLKSLGYSVICTKDGKEAVDYFIKERMEKRDLAGMIFDLTIRNGIGGKEAIIKIRELNKRIPVFVSSGYADDPVMANPKNYGFTASICKPFTYSEFAEMLNTYMPRKM